MKYYQPAAAFRRLCDAFDQMPGIGEQGAKRMVEWLMYQSDIRDLHEILGQAATLKICSSCNLAVEDPDHCPLCTDPEREPNSLAVLADSSAVQPLLDSGYSGQLYVLHGLLSPARRIGPASLRLPALSEYIQNAEFKQIYLALADCVEGRATADYISRTMPGQKTVSLSLAELLKQQSDTLPTDTSSSDQESE